MSSSRREFLEAFSLGSTTALAAGLLGCGQPGAGPGVGGAIGAAGNSSLRPLRAAFSNAGLQSTWCELGKRTAELWGRMLNVDIEWFDGEFDPEKQRNKIDAIVDRQWDFCCFQAVQTDSLADPVKRLKERSVPVISMDTLLVDLRGNPGGDLHAALAFAGELSCGEDVTVTLTPSPALTAGSTANISTWVCSGTPSRLLPGSCRG